MFELGGDGDSVNSRCVGDGSEQLTVVGINHVHLRSVREIQTSRSAVDRYVVEAAIARNGIASLDFISGTGLKEHQSSGHHNQGVLYDHWISPLRYKTADHKERLDCDVRCFDVLS